jgi:hypothetical protein
MAEHAWSLGVDVSQKVIEGGGDFLRVGPLEADLELIGRDRLDCSREMQESSKDAEDILGLIVDFVEALNEQFLGVACSDLESVDEQAPVFVKKRASLAGGGR